MCKIEGCQPVLAYKALDGQLYSDGQECQRANERIKQQRLKDKLESVLDGSLYRDYSYSKYNLDQRTYQYILRSFVSNWKSIRDQLNSVKEE